MLAPKEMAIVWTDIQKIFTEKKDLTPTDTVNSILKAHQLDDVLETFSAITRIKDGDGRIWHENREWMESISVMPECYDWRNPIYRHGEFFRTNLDAIHTTHINQMISELYERTHPKETK